ncbi:MAG: DUF5711 family protein [Clostridia bacterium]|nr:DUF5711 family protein [Clostridia bacterium]MDR3643994.1 DUF5711 family protein [Clostridia bacterium]
MNDRKVCGAPKDNVTRLSVKKKHHTGLRLLALVCLAAAGLAVWLNWGSISPSSAVIAIQAFLGEFGDSKFPVSYSQGSFRDAAALGGDVAVVTDSSLLIYTDTGLQIAERRHSLSNPRIAASGGRAVIYDEQGKSLRLESRFSELFSTTLDYPITAASVNSTGTVAAATSSQDYLSELTVFSHTGSQLFKWYCSTGRILSVAVSPDGQQVAASVISSENGSIKSSVAIYSLSQQTPVAQTDLTGTLIFSLCYQSNGNIAALGDNLTAILGSDGSRKATYDYSGKTLRCFCAGLSGTLLVFSRYGVGQESTLVSLGEGGAVAAQANVKDNIKYIAYDDGVTALGSTGLKFFTSKLAPSGSTAAAGDILKLLCIRSNAFYFTPATAYQHKIG